MTPPDLSARLERLGPPVFVTDDDEWRVVGVEGTRGKEDAVVVYSRNGALMLRTECLTREVQPAWVNIKNTQGASVHRPDATVADWDAVLVDEEEATLVVDGLPVPVSVLRSHQTPSLALTHEIGHCTLEIAGRRLVVAGHLDEVIALRVRTLHDLDAFEYRHGAWCPSLRTSTLTAAGTASTVWS